jgi:TRAP-type C4-dicarboxylate transport system substrate-binding protein
MHQEIPSGNYDDVDYLSNELPKLVFKNTNGMVDIEWRFGLYRGEEAMYPLANNIIQIGLVFPAQYAATMPEWNMSHVPFMVQSETEFMNFLDGGGFNMYGDTVFEKYDLNLIPIALWSIGPQIVWTKKPVRTVEDFAGIKFFGRALIKDAVELVGASGTSFAFTEVALALDRGVIDGIVTGDIAGINYGFYKSAPYAAYWPITMNYPSLLVVSKEAVEALPPEVRKQLLDTLAEAGDKMVNELRPVVIAKILSLMEENNVTVIYPEQAEIDKFAQLTLPIITEWAESTPETMKMLRLLEETSGRTILS